MIRRRMAMRAANTNRPEGRGYVEAFNRIMIKDELYDPNPKNPKEEARWRTTLTCVVWLHDRPERLQILRELRDAMSKAEPKPTSRRSKRGAARRNASPSWSASLRKRGRSWRARTTARYSI
jgi:hypothetical protein